jgi:hypothetical protein
VTDALVLERRREALKTAAKLQRRNVGIRWRTLRDKRAVQWVESGLAATRVLRDSSGAVITSTVGRSAGWLWLASALRVAARTRGGFLGSTLGVLRRPSLWSLAMLIGQWWWRRRSRRQRRHAAAARAARRWARRDAPLIAAYQPSRS